MCGIAAVFAYGRRARVEDRARLARMCTRMACRGPDGEGVWEGSEGRVLLGHRRLSIIDLSERGAQPMRTADGRYTVAFNGEIYNHRALRAGLEAKGYVFQSDCDTEVLLYLYADQGEAMVHALDGMFAFVIWDAERRTLFAARDAFGIKPLYIADDGSAVMLASEVKALLCAGGVDTRVEPAGHVGFLLWGHVPDPYTFYRGVRALPAGSTLCVADDATPLVRSYASVSGILAEAEREVAPVAERVADATLREALLESVASHLVADVPVAVFLSAGLDSTTLAALAGECGATLRTVTLGFAEQRGTAQDETRIAAEVATRYGAEHHTVWIDRAGFRSHVPNLLDRMDQPSIDGVNSYFVSLAAAESGVKVALSGLGGDELFGGYPSFRQLPRLVGAIGRVPGAPTLGSGFRYISAPTLRRFSSSKYAGLLEYGSRWGGAYLLRRGMFMPWELPTMLDPDLVAEGWRELATIARLDGTVVGIASPHLRVSALEATWYMRSQLLRDADWASMSHSIEVRVPLVDVALWRRVAPLLAASGSAVSGKQRMAATPSVALPEVVRTRAKTGFVAPTREWVMDEHATGGGERGLRGWARALYGAAA